MMLFTACSLEDTFMKELRENAALPDVPEDSLPVEMVWVASGSFQLGNDLDTGGDWDEYPVSSVTMSGFYIGKYQVTQGQYQAVMGHNPSFFKASSRENFRRPAEQVSWYDAIVFCNKLSLMEGLSPAYRISGSTNPSLWGAVPTASNAAWDAAVIVSDTSGYRLPTEAQWEYAAKGGNGSPGSYMYAGSNNPDNVAWYLDITTHVVGLKTPNGLHIHDMSGNVAEWCWDWFSFYTSDSKTDPAGPSGSSLRDGRVVRGGSWVVSASNLRSAVRHYIPSYLRCSDVGFRLVRP